jgi:hypothetical protein
MISKESILSKTHYGLSIYSHIFRLYYPDEVVLRLVGRDCGLCRNPFNADKETLHIFIEKADPTNVMSAEFARHEDTENAIAASDAFSFAELHYKQNGEELLQTLNKELNLRIGENRYFYHRPQSLKIPVEKQKIAVQSPEFSFFKAPVSNTKPHKAVTLLQIYNAIKGNYYKERTEKLRAISDVQQARKFKAANFDYCTFSGTFTSRNNKALIKHSGLLCLDFDHLSSVELSCKREQNSNSFEVLPSAADNIQMLFNRLLQDDYFDTQLLFRSPSGDGLKWIIPIDTAAATHGDYFAAVANYILQTCGIAVDKSGRDMSRACFLPHDPQAFINPQLK